MTQEIKNKIQDILKEKYTEEFFNTELSNRVDDYVNCDDVEEEGYDSPEEYYQNFAFGGAIEHDILYEAWKDIKKEFNLNDDDFEQFDKIMIPIFHKNCLWRDMLVF